MKLTINGLTHEPDVDDEMLLLRESREKLDLVGTRCGCSIRIRRAVHAAADPASRLLDEAGPS